MHICNGCHKKIQDEEEHFYIGYWYRNRVNSNVIHFHKSCFEDMAGLEYSERVMQSDVSYELEDVVDNATTSSSDPRIRWRYQAWKE